MRVAIVGSRDWPFLDAVREYVRQLPPDTVVVSGGAPGVDRAAEREARKRGLKVDIYEAKWAELGKGAGFIRNQTIVDNADEVVAFQAYNSRGTGDTIRRARTAGKDVQVFVYNGPRPIGEPVKL